MKNDLKEVLAQARSEELAYCAGDILYYVKTYVHIEDKDSAEVIVPFSLWPAQEQVLLDFTKYRMNLILKARQLGFTWLTLSYATRLLL